MIHPSHHKRGLLAWILLFAVFVVVPVAESALCGLDEEFAHASFVVSDEHQNITQSDSVNSVDGHCEHGHCHHTVPHVTALMPFTTYLVNHQIHQESGYEAVVSHMPDGLKRPPKV